jgi:signal transduction histidine kinase
VTSPLIEVRSQSARTPIGDAPHLPSTEEILAATAHELRLPLSHIKGFVTSMRRTDVEWDDNARKEFLVEIDLETDRLAELVDELCTPRSEVERGLAARTSDGGYKPDPDVAVTHPARIVQGALHRIRGLLEGRSLQVDVPPRLPSVRMDASQMERALANLIQNAIKYSPSSTAIGISARITEDGELVLSVEDKGPGIPAGDRERIFEPFFRNRMAERSKASGHGLGLAICKSIVLAHGGRIEVHDRPGGGARVSVFLPAPVRARQVDSNYQRKEQANDPATDSAENTGGGRRGADAQAPLQQPHRQRLRRTVSSRWSGGLETLRGAPVRPAAA